MLTKFMAYLKQNRIALIFLAAVAVLVTTAMLMEGCRLGGFIKHDVPPAMREFNDGQSKVSLDDAPFLLEDYMDSVERNLEKFQSDNENAQLVFTFISNALNIGLNELKNSPLPGASIGGGLLLGLAGLMIRKPGTAREISDEKMKSFNKGGTEAEKRMLAAMQALISPEQMQAMLAQLKGDA